MRHGRKSSVHAFGWLLIVSAALSVFGAVEAILRHGLVLMVVVIPATAAAYLAGRRHALRELRNRSRELPERLVEELAWYRRSLAELEEAAGRPLSVILASYRRVGRRYRTPGGPA